MIIKTPPMGWNSWNTFGANIDEKLIRETADAMVSTGLKDAGYEYVVIDDCWALRERDENGLMVPDPEKFPSGMKALADYIHSKGLKFGMYSCAGAMTCAGYPGSYNHEFVDAKTFASWDVDYLKYDYCYHSELLPGSNHYRRMGLALDNSGRDILLAACTWGIEKTHEWIGSTGASTWRSTGDIFDSWQSIVELARIQPAILPYIKPGCFNDMDMLVVGMYGEGNVGLAGCTDLQYRSHFALWSFMQSALMIGCDIRNMSDATLKTLTNKELIRFNQDKAHRQIFTIWADREEVLCFAKHLEGGEIGLCFFNTADVPIRSHFNMDYLSIPTSTGKTVEMTNVITGEVFYPTNGQVVREMDPFDCQVIRCKVVDA